jgi:hypothetical protein
MIFSKFWSRLIGDNSVMEQRQKLSDPIFVILICDQHIIYVSIKLRTNAKHVVMLSWRHNIFYWREYKH